MFGFTVLALDGTAGTVDDFYLDDEKWVIRYLVVNTGSELDGRRVLIAPAALDAPHWADRELPLTLTKKQVENSPNIDLDKPVSRQHQVALHDYYGWDYYWMSNPLGAPIMPLVPMELAEEQQDAAKPEHGDPHLQSVRAVVGYHIHATDGMIGHMQDLFIDEENWSIRYLLVATHDWLPGKKVLVDPQWIDRVSWAEHKVYVKQSRQQIKDSPAYDPAGPPSRDYESQLYQYYGFPGYWGGHWSHSPTEPD
ncbi:MAG: PRC-barrel domain-containing protein [Chloroflexi bacterium]|nr:PRC-barrel domain-containing protein [Chloroflexota bacterium]MBU1747299.1 PRC-barrel domain-containing protein [Chloroflexota bacterium]MBU1877332.1 PRC-barrel domain-containing protein [Chloroflexota bacterium]